ncbi:MAG: tetratricopeptide repeat protein [Janthinobacterium lividum]
MNRTRSVAIVVFCLLPVLGIGLLINHVSHYISAIYHTSKAPALARSGRLDEAVTESRLAVEADPQFEPGHNNLGFYLFKQGKFAEAEIECRKAVSLDPSDSHAHDSLGQLLSHTGRAEEAVQQCREAMRIRPNAVHLNSLAYALSQEGQWEEARQDWQQVTTMNDAAAAAEAQGMLAQRPN